MPATILLPGEEQEFQSWYADWAAKAGINPNPDDPNHAYDYRGAWKSGAEPQIDPADSRYHWPSQFKTDDHPNLVVDGVNTKTGQPVAPKANTGPRLLELLPDDPSKVPAILNRNSESLRHNHPAPAPSTNQGTPDLIPLHEYLQKRLQKRTVGSPTGERTSVEDMVRGGARALIPRLRGPVEIPAGHRVAPKTMTDAQPVAAQMRDKIEQSGPEFATTPMNVARPHEVDTPRESSTRDEVDRIMKLLDDITAETPRG